MIHFTFCNNILYFYYLLVIITEGGIATNIIPAKAVLTICIRAPTMGELKLLRSRVENCINGSAIATGCEVNYSFEEHGIYQNVIANKILGNLYKDYFERLGKYLLIIKCCISCCI